MQNKLFTTLVLVIMLAPGLFGQWAVVRETEKIMSFGSRPCFEIRFQNADEGLVLDVWRDFARKNFNAKLKRDRKSGEWAAYELNTRYVAEGAYTLFSRVEKEKDDVVFTAWFDVGPYFLNSKSDRAKSQETANVLKQFYFETRRGVIGQELKQEEKALADQEGKLKKLQRDNESLRKSIEDYKARIAKAEEDIQKNIKEQESTTVDIEAQKKKIEMVQKRIQNVENEGQ